MLFLNFEDKSLFLLGKWLKAKGIHFTTSMYLPQSSSSISLFIRMRNISLQLNDAKNQITCFVVLSR